MSREAVRELLNAAAEYGIDLVDTAAGYPGSEWLIGELENARQRFRIVTKVIKLNEDLPFAEAVKEARATIRSSLQKLQRQSIYGLIVHRASDLLGPDGTALHEIMVEAKEAGLVSKIGLSVGEARDIEAAMERFEIDIVQCPLNVLDQRLTDGLLAGLQSAGVEVHVRSVFLQGLLLRSVETVMQTHPFARNHLERFTDRAAELGLTPVQAAVGYVVSKPEVDAIVVGLRSPSELGELVAARDTQLPKDAFADLACTDRRIINPSAWTTPS
jgi:aryl-alcohol dehydrogenase-like predicted oxidoreductase